MLPVSCVEAHLGSGMACLFRKEGPCPLDNLLELINTVDSHDFVRNTPSGTMPRPLAARPWLPEAGRLTPPPSAPHAQASPATLHAWLAAAPRSRVHAPWLSARAQPSPREDARPQAVYDARHARRAPPWRGTQAAPEAITEPLPPTRSWRPTSSTATSTSRTRREGHPSPLFARPPANKPCKTTVQNDRAKRLA